MKARGQSMTTAHTDARAGRAGAETWSYLQHEANCRAALTACLGFDCMFIIHYLKGWI